MNDRSQAGFTLVELLIAMAMGIVVIGAGFAMLSQADASQNASASMVQRILERNAAIERIRIDLSRSTTRYCGPDVYWNFHTYGPLGFTDGYEAGVLMFPDGTNFMLDHSPVPLTAERVSLTGVLDVYWSESVQGQPTSQQTPRSNVMTTGSTEQVTPGDFVVYCTGDTAFVWPTSGTYPDAYSFDSWNYPRIQMNCGRTFTQQSQCIGPPICLLPPVGGDPLATCPSTPRYGLLSVLRGVRWYIAWNPRGGKSLYRSDRYVPDKGRTNSTEVLEDISQLKIVVNPDDPSRMNPKLIRLEIEGEQFLLRTGEQ